VISRAGRDTGKKFVVIRMIDNFFVEVSDGDLRRIEKPKKKKIKHLNSTNDRVESLEEKLKSGVRITNAEIRKALAGLDIQQNEK
jgi:ribosomal protein L14E/L6E/L27E